jgi:hypothetical protein
MNVYNTRRLCIAGFVLSLAAQANARAQPHPFVPSAALSSATTISVLDIRGGAARVAPNKPVASVTVTKKVVLEDQSQHHGELMSAQTAVANVLADLCPHGMLPIAFGMAAGGGTGPVLATIILFIFGVLSWYSLVSFARYVGNCDSFIT